MLFGQISKTATTFISMDYIDVDCFLKINDKNYEILRASKVFNKYAYDLEVKNNE